MAAIIDKTQKKTSKTGFLTDVNPDYVSLVRHGANQKPFKVIKKEKEGTVQRIIQSVVLKKDVKLEDVVSVKGLEYLSDINEGRIRKSDDYTVYDQVDPNNVQNMRMIPVGNHGYIIVGELAEGKKVDKEDIITLSESQVQKLDSAFPVPVAYSFAPSMASMFFDAFDRELYSMTDIIYGTLRQSSIAPAAMKKTILGAIDAFRSFMSLSMDSLATAPGATAKCDKIGEVLEKLKTKKAGGNEIMYTFNTEEEFNKAVDLRIVDLVKQAKAQEADPDVKETKQAPEVKSEKADSAPAGEEASNGTEKTDQTVVLKALGELGKRIEKIEKSVAAPAGSSETEDPPEARQKSEGDEKKNPFSGFFTRKLPNVD